MRAPSRYQFVVRVVTVIFLFGLIIKLGFHLRYDLLDEVPGYVRHFELQYIDSAGTPRWTAESAGWHPTKDENTNILIHFNSAGIRGPEIIPTVLSATQ